MYRTTDMSASSAPGRRSAQTFPSIEVKSRRSSGDLTATSTPQADALRAGFPVERLTIDFTRDVGHSLGDNATYGPMHADWQKAIVEVAIRLATLCRPH